MPHLKHHTKRFVSALHREFNNRKHTRSLSRHSPYSRQAITGWSATKRLHRGWNFRYKSIASGEDACESIEVMVDNAVTIPCTLSTVHRFSCINRFISSFSSSAAVPDALSCVLFFLVMTLNRPYSFRKVTNVGWSFQSCGSCFLLNSHRRTCLVSNVHLSAGRESSGYKIFNASSAVQLGEVSRDL